MKNLQFHTPDLDPNDIDALQELFSGFRSFYGKDYGSSAEVEYRFDVFKTNFADAKKLNDLKTSARYGINQFSDMTRKEFIDYVSTPLSGLVSIDHLPQFDDDTHGSVLDTTDDFEDNSATYVDWRLSRCTGPIKSQGTCNSCWAMVANGVLEILDCANHSEMDPATIIFSSTNMSNEKEMLLQPSAFEDIEETDTVTGELKNRQSPFLSDHYRAFSEQYLIDCDKEPHDPFWIAAEAPFPRAPNRNYGCLGGFAGYSLTFFKDNLFTVLQSEMPYKTAGEMCKPIPEDKRVDVSAVSKGAKVVRAPRDVNGMRELLKKSPVTVSVCINAPEFHLYNGGIMEDIGNRACWDEEKKSFVTNHAVILVGFAEEENSTDGEEPKKYFTFRNSWGNWGEGGYGRLRARDVGNDKTKDVGDFGWAARPLGWVRDKLKLADASAEDKNEILRV